MYPLELTPLELLFFNDNRSGRPASFLIQLDLSGEADQELLNQAFGHACSRHPLVNAKVKRGPGRRWCWQDNSQPPEIEWIQPDETIGIAGREKIDLRQQVGLRVWASRSQSATKVLMEFNHACTDGIGAYRLIGDWLAIYHSLYSGNPWDEGLPTIDETRLPVRFDRLKKEIRAKSWLSRLGTMLREGFNYLGPPITRLHPKKSEKKPTNRQFPELVSQSLSPEEHQALKNVAGQTGYTVNDLLITELFLTIAEWNQNNPSWSWSWRKRIRLSLPTDMRDQSDYATSASNMTALVFLTRHQKELGDAEQLRFSVREEVLKIRNERKGIDNLITLDSLSNFPLIPALWLSTRVKCCYSAVISNIGDPTRRMLNRFQKEKRKIVAGNLKLDLITGVPPMRPDTNLSVSIFTYCRLLTISFRCDPGLFDCSATEELLSIYTRRLRSYFAVDMDSKSELNREPTLT